MVTEEARCDIVAHAWPLPPRPPDCDTDFGSSAVLDLTHPGKVGICEGDTVGIPTRILAYGHALRLGPLQCASQPAAVTCEVIGGPHRFTVSREAYSVA